MSTTDDVSIAATDATVAGSSVAITEAEEDAASFSPSSDSNTNKLILTKEALLDISISNEEEDELLEEEYAARPMHLHALRTPAKLKGAPRSRSSSRSRPGSRRNSVSPPRNLLPGATTAAGEMILGSTVSPSISVSSSLDGIGEHQGGHTDIIDPDILLDKLGFRDLDANVTTEELRELLRKHISSNSGLATLNERMSEESMDDVHAFQDLQFVSRASKDALISKEEECAVGDEDSPEKGRRSGLLKNNSQQGMSSSAVMGGSMSYLLSTLDEEEDEGGEDDEGGDVILEIPKGLVLGEGKTKGKKNRNSVLSTMAVANEDSMDEDDEDDDNAVQVPTSVIDELKISEGRRKKKHHDTSVAQAGMNLDFLEDELDEEDDESEDEDQEGGDVILDIPQGIVAGLGEGKSNRRKNRDSLVSTMTMANASTIDDDEDSDNADVTVPTSIFDEMKISEERRKLRHRDTSITQTGFDLDFLEADEQDGLEADLADGDEPR